MPGIDKDDIDVEIKDNLLTIKGERKKESEEEAEGVYRSERSYGSFCRSFGMPKTIDTDTANAKFKNGVLEVRFKTAKSIDNGNKLEIDDGTVDAKVAGSGG